MLYLSTIESRKAKLQESIIAGKSSDEKYRIINDMLLIPKIVDLTNQYGTVHTSELNWWYTRQDQKGGIKSLSLYRERLPRQGFWNAIARFLGENQEVLRIKFNGQLWVVNYYVPSYYVTAEEVRADYYETWAKDFGGNDMVILGT